MQQNLNLNSNKYHMNFDSKLSMRNESALFVFQSINKRGNVQTIRLSYCRSSIVFHKFKFAQVYPHITNISKNIPKT